MVLAQWMKIKAEKRYTRHLKRMLKHAATWIFHAKLTNHFYDKNSELDEITLKILDF
jgi:hypothetical protein